MIAHVTIHIADGDLVTVLGEPQPKVSRHLALLRDAGLVEVRADGKWKFYALAQPPTARLATR